MPVDFRNFGQSVFATTFFASNFQFWSESGYFDAPSEVKPLLHTWSLAVEEQYYIVFPVFLFLVHRYCASLLKQLIVLIAVASFALSVYSVVNHPSAAFYLAPTRAWELMLGAALAVGVVPELRSRGARNTASFTGIALIAWSVVMFSGQTAFPGASALVPCLGAALVIYAGINGSSLPGRLLSTGPIVFVGLISYSLYLWHWPLLVYAKYYLIRDLTTPEAVSILVASFFMSVFSYRFVELPFRRREGVFRKRGLFVSALTLMVGVMAVGAAIRVFDGYPGRLPSAARQYAAGADDRNPASAQCHTISPRRVRAEDLCRLGPDTGVKPEFIVWGDSHADALMPAFKMLADRFGTAGWFASYTGCPPLLGVSRVDLPPSHLCKEFNDAMIEVIRRNRIRKVVLVAQWSVYVAGWEQGGANLNRGTPNPYLRLGPGDNQASRQSSERAFADSLGRTVRLLADTGAEIWFVQEVPSAQYIVPSTLARATISGRPIKNYAPRLSDYVSRQEFIRKIVSNMKKVGNFNWISLADFLCGEEICDLSHDGKSLYHDSHHLSTYGARYVAPALLPIFGRQSRE